LLLPLLAASSTFAQIEPSIEAHGGVAKWKSYRSLEFDQTWTSARGVKKDHQLFDLHSRNGVITSDKYTLGASNGEVWIKPALDALGGTPPRFYMWTPFYFFAMPFVFGDPGVVQEALGKKTFQGQEYDAVKITFKKGTGDSADDFYVAYIDPSSRQLKLVIYVVTYSALRKGKPMDQLEPHALVFDEWQGRGRPARPEALLFLRLEKRTDRGRTARRDGVFECEVRRKVARRGNVQQARRRGRRAARVGAAATYRVTAARWRPCRPRKLKTSGRL
jgi:hypothetical protein